MLCLQYYNYNKKKKIRIGKKSTVSSIMDGTRSKLLEINTI